MPRWSRGRLSGAGRHSRLLTAAGLGIFVLFALLPVWVVEYFPSQDGPNHLLIAEVWSHYDEADADLSRAYFALNPHIEPNLAVYPLLALFGHLTDPATAEKLLVSLVVILWAMAGVYAVASVKREAWPLSLLLVPIIFGYHLHMGYYNFVLSLSGFVFVFGYWVRHRWRLTWPRLLLLSAASLVLVAVHLVGFVVLAYAIGLSSLVLWLHARRAAGCPRPSWQDLGRQWLKLGLAFLPPILLAASFVLHHHVYSEAPPNPRSLVRELFTGTFLFSFNSLESVLALPWLLAGASLALWRLRAGVRNGLALALSIAIVGLILIYFFVPLRTRGVPLSGRLVPFMAALGVLWLASGYRARLAAFHKVALVGAVVSTLLLTAHRVAAYSAIEDYTREYLSAARHIEPRSTLLTMNFWGPRDPVDGEHLTWLTDPFLHLGARIAAQTQGVFLRAPGLSPVVNGYFPIVYRSEVDPYRLFAAGSLEPEDKHPKFVDIASYNDRTSGRLDYVLFWPMTPDIAAQPAVDAITGELSRNYDLVYVSSGRGLVHLYRRLGSRRR